MEFFFLGNIFFLLENFSLQNLMFKQNTVLILECFQMRFLINFLSRNERYFVIITQNSNIILSSIFKELCIHYNRITLLAYDKIFVFF
jgi:hypothetical protein